MQNIYSDAFLSCQNDSFSENEEYLERLESLKGENRTDYYTKCSQILTYPIGEITKNIKAWKLNDY